MRHLTLKRFRRPRTWPLAIFAAALLLATGLCAPATSHAATSAEAARDAVRKAFAGGDYQRNLPLPDKQSDQTDLWSDPNWWHDEGEHQAADANHPALPKPKAPGFNLHLPPALAEALRLLMWGGIVVGISLLAYYLINETLLYLGRKKTDWQPPADEPSSTVGGAGVRAVTLADCDRMAADGDYAGAIHMLLLYWIGRLREKGANLSSSMTNREILRRLQLADNEREALSLLVRLAELTHFGGRAASESDFQECRALYDRVAAGGAA